MPLRSRSLFTYGIQVTELNRSIDFRIENAGEELNATLTLGFYSVSSLAVEVKRALEEADLDNEYTVTVDRTAAGGTQNRITIETDGAFLELLFGTGTREASSAADLLGFASSDCTGDTEYTGTGSVGYSLVSPYSGNDWIPPSLYKKNLGVVNVTASGFKEAITFATQKFFQVRFTWISDSSLSEWEELMTWLVAQKPIDFTPEISSPATVYEASLESTPFDSSGLGFTLPESPKGSGLYDTGILKFRIKEA